jgi:PIN domain nuclease of toxin-antitoxin system
MNLLFDTHVALWALTEDAKLSPQGRALIVDPSNTVAVSVVSLWEISIKNALRRKGPSPLPFSAGQALRLFEAGGFGILPITAAHAVAVEALDLLHGDPFDRLLIAQALTEPLRVVTHDRTLASYSDTVIPV